MALVASLVATVVSAVFALRLGGRVRRRGRTEHANVAWALALTMFSVASLMLVLGVAVGWHDATFRTFYLLGAVLNVPVLALGSVVVNAERRVPTVLVGVVVLLVSAAFVPPAVGGGTDAGLYGPGAVAGALWGLVHLLPRPAAVRLGALAVLVGFAAVAVVVVVTADLAGPLPATGVPEGRELFAESVRGFAVAGNVIGATTVVLGALFSSAATVWRWPDPPAHRALRAELGDGYVDALARWVYRGRRGDAPPGVVRGNLLIAAGVALAAMGGALSFLGTTTGHAVGLGLGVTVMYAGFTRSSRRPTATAPPRVATAGTR